MSERHLSEEELILHHYGEAEDAAAESAHLRDCAACAAALRELERTLALVPADAPPARDAAYGARVFESLRGRLATDALTTAAAQAKSPAQATVPRSSRWRLLPSHLPAWGALAASLLLAFWLGRQFPADTPEPVVRERILLVAVGDHLERSRMVLAELSNTADGPADIRSEQQWAASLVAENRLYRQAAQRSGDAGVASVLEELERVLTEVANGPEVLSARQLDDLRARIEARGLLFKAKVVEGQVRAKARRTPAHKEMSS
jgi:hypothetical protein